ncbi:hypothetical protein T07_13383 [Trichinella nelsoni]|uniref:Uncharacterized protein n=1 Tax=Trichinella nelsoni TaxID=6336 RepID=A0A0V0RYQ2_9BILA|nr:hypothetical protein T07_13383 [Trichinella nelsoni]
MATYYYRASAAPFTWRSEATAADEPGGQEKPDWLGGQQRDERGSDEEVHLRKSMSRVCVCFVLSVYCCTIKLNLPRYVWFR